MHELISGSVLAWARLRLDCHAGSVEHGVALSTRDGLEGLRVPFAVELEPLVVSQQFVLLLSLVDLLLTRQQFLFSPLVIDPSV